MAEAGKLWNDLQRFRIPVEMVELRGDPTESMYPGVFLRTWPAAFERL